MTPDDADYGWTHDPDARTFRKTLPPRLADLEQDGWQRVAHLLPVPHLLERIDDGAKQTLVYEDVFAKGCCRRLLADAITAADTDPSSTSDVTALIDAVCDTWASAAGATGEHTPLGDCVGALYADRLRPGGRLDTWYGDMPSRTVTTHYGTYDLRLPAILGQLRGLLTPDSVWPTAITQGDPTEPNIADPLCWLDFEHAGRNTLAGEAANLLWYLLGMGGWLVPAYQPTTYMRTLRHRGHGAVPPDITHLQARGGHIEVDFTFRARPGRRAAIDALLTRLRTDLGGLLTPAGTDVDEALRPWLTVRILGVIPLAAMSSADRAVCLATLAHTLDPNIALDDVTITTSPDLTRAT